MTSPVRAAAAAASSASTALTSHNGKNKISEQQTSADLATQNAAKRLKLNDGSAAAGAGAGAQPASGAVINAATCCSKGFSCYRRRLHRCREP